MPVVILIFFKLKNKQESQVGLNSNKITITGEYDEE